MGEARPQSADHLPFGPRRRQTAASPSGQLELPTQSSRRAFGKAVIQRVSSGAGSRLAGGTSLWSGGLGAKWIRTQIRHYSFPREYHLLTSSAEKLLSLNNLVV